MSITKDFEGRYVEDELWGGWLRVDVEVLLAYARAVEAQNGELIAMLRKYEWWEGTCLECDQWEPNHLPGCDLDRLIKGGSSEYPREL